MRKRTWAEETYDYLMEKKRNGYPLTMEEYESLAYCEECFAEDEADEEYLDNYSICG